jgi:hypothetical protein
MTAVASVLGGFDNPGLKVAAVTMGAPVEHPCPLPAFNMLNDGYSEDLFFVTEENYVAALDIFVVGNKPVIVIASPSIVLITVIPFPDSLVSRRY